MNPFCPRIFALSVLLSLAIFPPAASAISIGVGPIGGWNLGNADVSNHSNTTNRNGLALGAVGELGVTSPFSLMLEPMYVQKGARFNVSAGPFGAVSTRGDLDYVEIPLLVKAKFGALAAHAYVFLGPSLGINVNSKGSFGSFSDTFKDQTNSTTFSGDAGVGGAVRMVDYVYLFGDARYSYGFTNALKSSVGDIDSWKSRDIRLMLGLLVHIAN